MIVSLYVCNTTYVYKAVTEGSSLSEPLTYDNKGWFRVTFTGIDASGSETGRVEHYRPARPVPSRGGTKSISRRWDAFTR